MLHNVMVAHCLKLFGLVQLLQKQSIVSMTGADKLLEVVPGPISRYLPVGSKKIGEFTDKEMFCFAKHLMYVL